MTRIGYVADLRRLFPERYAEHLRKNSQYKRDRREIERATKMGEVVFLPARKEPVKVMDGIFYNDFGMEGENFIK